MDKYTNHFDSQQSGNIIYIWKTNIKQFIIVKSEENDIVSNCF